MVKAHVSPGLGAKTKPQIEQRSSWDHPEKSRPSPQCGQRLRSPRRIAVLINVDREGVIPTVVCPGAERTLSRLVRSMRIAKKGFRGGGLPASSLSADRAGGDVP